MHPLTAYAKQLDRTSRDLSVSGKQTPMFTAQISPRFSQCLISPSIFNLLSTTYDLSPLASSAYELCLFCLSSMKACARLPTMTLATVLLPHALVSIKVGAIGADWYLKQGRHTTNYPLLSFYRNHFHPISGPLLGILVGPPISAEVCVSTWSVSLV